MDVVTNDLPRVSIGYQAQIGKLLTSRQIGAVSHPDFLRSLRYPFQRSVQKVRVPPESMMTVCGLVIRPALGYEQPSPPE